MFISTENNRVFSSDLFKTGKLSCLIVTGPDGVRLR
jgi:hypothetical protein